mmetsp:Transcript_33216/g.83731  ORF Transcript_33216/g.83731 Transcript_33216/m.83731 type:complete len:205 (+) Transcript_33216:813-1427(+)
MSASWASAPSPVGGAGQSRIKPTCICTISRIRWFCFCDTAMPLYRRESDPSPPGRSWVTVMRLFCRAPAGRVCSMCSLTSRRRPVCMIQPGKLVVVRAIHCITHLWSMSCSSACRRLCLWEAVHQRLNKAGREIPAKLVGRLLVPAGGIHAVLHTSRRSRRRVDVEHAVKLFHQYRLHIRDKTLSVHLQGMSYHTPLQPPPCAS